MTFSRWIDGNALPFNLPLARSSVETYDLLTFEIAGRCVDLWAFKHWRSRSRPQLPYPTTLPTPPSPIDPLPTAHPHPIPHAPPPSMIYARVVLRCLPRLALNPLLHCCICNRRSIILRPVVVIIAAMTERCDCYGVRWPRLYATTGYPDRYSLPQAYLAPLLLLTFIPVSRYAGTFVWYYGPHHWPRCPGAVLQRC